MEQEEDEKKEERRSGSHLPILHRLLNFLQKGHFALKRGRISSLVTRILLISVWFSDLSVGETCSPVYSLQVYLSADFSTPKQRCSVKAVLPSLSPWHGLTGGCALWEQNLIDGRGLKMFLTHGGMQGRILVNQAPAAGLAAITECWNLSGVGS